MKHTLIKFKDCISLLSMHPTYKHTISSCGNEWVCAYQCTSTVLCKSGFCMENRLGGGGGGGGMKKGGKERYVGGL